MAPAGTGPPFRLRSRVWLPWITVVLPGAPGRRKDRWATHCWQASSRFGQDFPASANSFSPAGFQGVVAVGHPTSSPSRNPRIVTTRLSARPAVGRQTACEDLYVQHGAWDQDARGSYNKGGAVKVLNSELKFQHKNQAAEEKS